MPVIEVRTPGDDERDLSPILVPATSANALYQLPDLTKTGLGEQYISCLVTNAAGGVVTLKDSQGRLFPVQAGQPADCDFEPGVTWLGLVPDVTLTAGQVVLVPRVRRPKRVP